MSADELISRASDSGSRTCAEAAGGLAAPPALHTTVITCMDARIDPVALFGLHPGDVHVLRNAGGVVTDDVVRSLVASQRKLGTRAVLLISHTKCGMASFTDEAFADELEEATGQRPEWTAHTFVDPAEEVARGLARLQSDPFLLKDAVYRGFVLDIATFGLAEIAPSA